MANKAVQTLAVQTQSQRVEVERVVRRDRDTNPELSGRPFPPSPPFPYLAVSSLSLFTL